jgi:hypothetical protein
MSDVQYNQVVGGPSREDLFDGLRLRHKADSLQTFTIMKDESPRSTIRVSVVTPINGIEAEDGSGDNWIVKIQINKESARIYYNSNRRSGCVIDDPMS